MYASYCLSTHRRLSLHAVFLTAFVAPMIVPAQVLEEIVVTIGRSICVVGGVTGVGGGTAVGTNERFLPPSPPS